ncbi:potassium channel family protein [Kocuria sp. CH-021]|uniref:potassium channel family protein n=1 Tax=Kocuria sp. CH-021 TaxID=3406735 RepID=UPI003C713E65
MDEVFTLLGLGLVGFGLYDVFRGLLYPSGRGTISFWVLRLVWRLSRSTDHRWGSLAGPLGVVVVIVLWGMLQAFGWALVYYPYVPEGFYYAEGMNPEEYDDFAEALHISLVTLGTLGFGDVVPTGAWLRFVSPIEALIGFALLTATVSWFIQIYPALARRRALAVRLRALQAVGFAERVAHLDRAGASRTVDQLTADVVDVHVALVQNAESYYFREVKEDAALAVFLPYAMEIAARAGESPAEEVRLSAAMLSSAVSDIGQHLRTEFHGSGESTEEVLGAYATDHGYSPGPGGRSGRSPD